MQTTTNYGLKKPEQNEYISIDDLNFNADKIDEELKKKADESGGDVSVTKTSVTEPADSTKYPAIPATGGALRTMLGYLTRWVKSLKDDKVDISGGDIANTKVSAIATSTASFPTLTVNDTVKTIVGKINKWFSDCTAKFGNYVLKSMITNQQVNSTNNIPTSALVYAMQQAITQLNSDLNTRSAVADLLAEADKGANCKRIVQCSANTKNTPYTAGLMNTSSATAFICMSSVQFGTIFYVPSGNRDLYIKIKSNGSWLSDWYKISLSNHNHDDRYYTEDEIDSLLATWKKNVRTTYTSSTTGLEINAWRIRNVVLLHIKGFPKANITPNTDIVVATLAADYRPTYNMPWNSYDHQGATNPTPFLFRVYSNGNALLNCDKALDSNQYINVIYEYPVW